MSEGKKHVSIVICGHVDAGKSTTTGRLIFELGGISEREMTKLKDEAKALGKDSFAFAFYMDKSKEERARGVTIACTTKGKSCAFVPFLRYTCFLLAGRADLPYEAALVQSHRRRSSPSLYRPQWTSL